MADIEPAEHRIWKRPTQPASNDKGGGARILVRLPDCGDIPRNRLRHGLPWAHQIAVSSMKGGVGRTTVCAALGLTLAECRGDRIVAVDTNRDAGTLADRLTGQTGRTARELLEDFAEVDSLTAVSRYMSMAGRLHVLASEQDQVTSRDLTKMDYRRLHSTLAQFYNITITDVGTDLAHSANEGTLALADSLVLVAPPTADRAARASATLDWLSEHGYSEIVSDAVVVLCQGPSPRADRGQIRAQFQGRTRAVVEIPYDPHLAAGKRVELDALRDNTRRTFLELAALIAEDFSL
ncbi:MinD/ParA family ATP-binding protein [Pseudonocardia spinosispora]|uniref:MinD/ParA family ATP-binding protein n=1 Tax=Pseudonocardia spinosispora TaxID=103441 RepID=UPI0012EBB7C6|nr:MinD/ParA family protein [Pseudonocardia spinosispora]